MNAWRTNPKGRLRGGYLHNSVKILILAIAMCQRAKICVLFNLFRNVMNYRNLRVMYVSVIYRHETHLCSILIHYTMHVFARKQCILCYALRQKSYLTLPYVTSLWDSFCLGTFAHGFIMRPPRSLASSLGCSLAIVLRDRLHHGSWEGDCTYIRQV